MDLSSLEGPPIHDPRFTITPTVPISTSTSTFPTPAIRLDRPPLHEERLHRALPRRPASAETPPRERFHSSRNHTRPTLRIVTPASSGLGGSRGEWPRPRSLEFRPNPGVAATYFPSSSSSFSCSSGHLHPNPGAVPRSVSGPGPGMDPDQGQVQRPSPSPGFRPSRGPRSASHLVWIESERMWVVTERVPGSWTWSQSQAQNQYQYPRSQPHSPAIRPQTQTRSMHSSPAPIPNETPTRPLDPLSPEESDLPPPPSYESHRFDRVVSVQAGLEPGDVGVGVGSDFDLGGSRESARDRDRRSASEGPSATSTQSPGIEIGIGTWAVSGSGQDTSRWTAVARRLSRGSVD